MRFLANENFPLMSVRLLRAAAHDVTSIQETQPGASDSDVLIQAAAEGRVILTFDRDYGELIYRRKAPVPLGMIYLRFAPQSPREPADLILNLVNLSGLRLEGRFTVIDRQRARQRPLPS